MSIEALKLARAAITCAGSHYECESLERCALAAIDSALSAQPAADRDVTRILLDVVPGDGDGIEVYAKSVDDVVDRLTEMAEQIEALQSKLKRKEAEEDPAHEAADEAPLPKDVPYPPSLNNVTTYNQYGPMSMDPNDGAPVEDYWDRSGLRDYGARCIAWAAAQPAVGGAAVLEPTEEMVQAGAEAAREYMHKTGGNCLRVIWAAMCAAQPQPSPVAPTLSNAQIDELLNNFAISVMFGSLDDRKAKGGLIRTALSAYPVAQAVPDGFVLVPVEPDDRLIAKLRSYWGGAARGVWADLLAASQQPVQPTA